MANTLGVYNPIFYANEALIQLEEAMGMAPRVYRAFEQERNAFGRGDTINIRRPSTFTAANAPVSTPSNLNTETVSVSLNNWKEVKFKLTDKELAYTQDRIITDHIRPAAVALANDIDIALANLGLQTGNYVNLGSTPGAQVSDIINMRKALFDLKAPVMDIANLHLMVDSAMEAELLGLTAFSQQQGAGDVGVNTQMRGSLGTKYGVEIFANQNVQDFTETTSADVAGAVSGAHAVGVTSLAVASFGTSDVYPAGTIFTIAGDTQKYAVTADATMSSGAGTFSISPALKVAVSGSEVISIDKNTDTTYPNVLCFHRNAMALVIVPLSDSPNELGARVATVTDPVTGLSLRSRVYYVGNSSEVHVALDVLYGTAMLDPNLVVRGRDT